MGKKIAYDTALKMAHTEPNNSIFAKDNPYGYKLNVNHPEVRKFYDYYKAKVGEFILSDHQRRTFEMLFLQMREKKINEQSNIDGQADR